MKLFATIIFVSLITGCTISDNEFYERKINKNVWGLCKTLNSQQPTDIQTLVKPYGKPQKSHTEEKANKHIPNAKDYIKTYTYLGGEVIIYSVPHINRNYLTTIKLSEKYWPSHIKSYLGAKISSLINILGKPNKRYKNKIQYSCSIESNDYIEFSIKNNKVNGLKIQAWVD